MPRHLLFFGKLLNLSASFLLFFCGADIICKQSATCTFKKISFTPRTIGESNVKGAFLSAFEPGNDFLGRGDKAKGARQIVGRPERQNTQWDTAIDEPAGDLCNRPISAAINCFLPCSASPAFGLCIKVTRMCSLSVIYSAKTNLTHVSY